MLASHIHFTIALKDILSIVLLILHFQMFVSMYSVHVINLCVLKGENI